MTCCWIIFIEQKVPEVRPFLSKFIGYEVVFVSELPMVDTIYGSPCVQVKDISDRMGVVKKIRSVVHSDWYGSIDFQYSKVTEVLNLFDLVKDQLMFHQSRSNNWWFAHIQASPEIKTWDLDGLKRQSMLWQNYYWPSITHIFFICSPENEPKHFEFLCKTMSQHDIPESYYTFWAPTYGKVTDSQMQEFRIKSNALRMTEISLIYNFYSLARFIKDIWKQGAFLILEADVIFTDLFWEKISTLHPPANFHAVNIGSGTDEVPPNARNDQFYYPMRITRCTEAILWSLEGLEAIRGYQDLTKPLDLHFNDVLKRNQIDMYWTYPSLVEQGSHNGTYASTTGNFWLSSKFQKPSETQEVWVIVLSILLAISVVIHIVVYSKFWLANKHRKMTT